MLENKNSFPRIWALLGARTGDNNQVLALAKEIGLPFEIKPLQYNLLRHLQPPLLGATLRSLTKASRAIVRGDTPNLTISAGHRSVPVVQAIRAASQGKTRSVHIGFPRISPERFDLVVATSEYPLSEHPCVLRVPIAVTRADHLGGSSDFWKKYHPPRRVLILGGPTTYWSIDPRDVQQALRSLTHDAALAGGSVLVVGSVRTPRRLLAQVEDWLQQSDTAAALVPTDGPPSFKEILTHGDSFTVTADSTAMISDAIVTGRPVFLLPVRPTVAGRLAMGLADKLFPGRKLYPRDLRRFWRDLNQRGLLGLRDESAQPPDVLGLVADRARSLVLHGDDQPYELHTAGSASSRSES